MENSHFFFFTRVGSYNRTCSLLSFPSSKIKPYSGTSQVHNESHPITDVIIIFLYIFLMHLIGARRFIRVNMTYYDVIIV